MTTLELQTNHLEEIRGKTSTQTCRRIIRILYPDEKARTAQSMAKMDKTELMLIIGK